jgi:hydroxymethylpyrimidine pyrophosphatase-like HAD family hydrolase
LPLIAAAGLGIAMGHAPSHVREQAKLVVSAPDGVAEAIERFVLEPRQPPVLSPPTER